MSRRILVSGAGVAGPALAFWLHRRGCDVTVVERATGLRSGGHAIDFRGTATRVLERMGLTDAVKQHETRTGTIAMVDAQGNILSRLPEGFTSGDIEIPRGDLVRILHEATREDVAYRFGDSIAHLEQTGTGVDVGFAGGSRDRFDLVIGADGLHSNTRALAFPAGTRAAHAMGYHLALFTVPDYLGLHDQGRYYLQRGKRVSYFATPHDGLARASFYFSSAYLGRTGTDAVGRDSAAQKQLLRDLFADVGWEARRLLDHLDAAPDWYFDALSQTRMDRWSCGRVALLGDAAGCPSPLAGMGTSLAFVGAYTLARELSRCGNDFAAAFARYEAALRPMADAAQKMARSSLAWLVPQTRARLWASRRLWSWMPESMMRKLMIDQPDAIARLVPLDEHAPAEPAYAS